MGNQQYQEHRGDSHSNRWKSPQFEKFSAINSDRLPEIHQIFNRTAENDGLINRSEFGRLYRELNIGSNDETSIDKTFHAFDGDGSGKLSFDEFLSAAIMLNKNNQNSRERITYLIDSNNPNGYDNQNIPPNYGKYIVNNMNKFYGINADFDQIWSKLDRGNGLVSREEFVTYISQIPTFAKYF
jgi:hypothetical protein